MLWAECTDAGGWQCLSASSRGRALISFAQHEQTHPLPRRSVGAYYMWKVEVPRGASGKGGKKGRKA